MQSLPKLNLKLEQSLLNLSFSLLGNKLDAGKKLTFQEDIFDS